MLANQPLVAAETSNPSDTASLVAVFNEQLERLTVPALLLLADPAGEVTYSEHLLVLREGQTVGCLEVLLSLGHRGLQVLTVTLVFALGRSVYLSVDYAVNGAGLAGAREQAHLTEPGFLGASDLSPGLEPSQLPPD